MRRVLLALLPCAAMAQTQPVRPQTPDIPVFSGFALPTPVASEKLGSEPLSVDEAVRIALANQPLLRSSAMQAAAARARAQQAGSGLLPQLSLSYSGSDSREFRGSDVTPGGGLGFRSNGSATVSQLLFDFGRTRAFARQQGALATAFEHGHRYDQLSFSFAVRQAFFGLVRAQRLEGVSSSNLENRRSQLALADARLSVGLGAPADLVRAKNSVGEATIALTNARAATISARVSFALSLGVDPRTPIVLAESSEAEVSEGIDELVVFALQERPDVQQALAEVRASGHALTFARATNAPSVSVFSTFSTRGTQDPLLNQTGSVGVNFRWTLSDGGLGAGRTREARAQLESSRALLDSLQQSVVGEVVQAHVDLEAAEQRLLTAQAQVANAQELLRISTGRYQGEVGSFLEVTDAQDAVFSAERNLANALADVQVARAALRLAVGRA